VNIITTDSLPDDIHITEVLGVVEATCPVRISQGPLSPRGESESRHIRHHALAELVAAAPQAANIIYGLRVSTSVGSFANGPSCTSPC